MFQVGEAIFPKLVKRFELASQATELGAIGMWLDHELCSSWARRRAISDNSCFMRISSKKHDIQLTMAAQTARES